MNRPLWERVQMDPDAVWSKNVLVICIYSICKNRNVLWVSNAVLFSFSFERLSRPHFFIQYFIFNKKKNKKKNVPLAIWCTFHFWHLLYMQCPAVLSPRKKIQNEELNEPLNQTLWVAKSNLPVDVLVQCGDVVRTSSCFQTCYLWLEAFGVLGWTCLCLVCVRS